MPDWNKPLPTIVGETRPFWEACRRGQLVIQRCAACGEYQFYPRGICAHCWSEEVRWVETAGRGTVWTYTVTYQNRTPGFAEDVPYIVALVELEEGVKMFTNLVDCIPREAHIGMAVEVTFTRANDRVTVPYFKPAAAGNRRD